MTDEERRDRRDLRRPSPRVRRRRVIAALIVAVVFTGAVIGSILLFAPHPQEENVAESPTPTPTQSTPSPHPTGPIKSTFDKRAFSIDDPASLWVVVNKLRPLNPQDYAAPDLVDVPVPHVYSPQLRQEASDQIVAMFAAFTAETGLQMQSQSAYRSYAAQQSVYGGNDTLTARPGYSEHQTGLAMDISALPNVCALQICFADTPQGQWLAANAYKYGFVLRYPDGMTDITGYQFEPWHYRYVGIALATEMHDTGIATLEQFFGLPAAPNYQ
ncbi:MAG: D-alanyl-D-alanine carboxypeptidase family protein [Microbacteriaceae bacterium]